MKKTFYFMMMMTAVMAAACCSDKQDAPRKGIDQSYLDTTVSPKVDFYAHAAGGWMKANPLKPEFARFGSFDVIAEATRENLNALFADMAKMDAEFGTVDQKISDLYKMGLDSTARNAAGAQPMPPLSRPLTARKPSPPSSVRCPSTGKAVSTASVSKPT